jgi:hypothetical protein
MFGRVGQVMDRNVIICLSVVAGILLLTGLAVAVTAPSASAQRVTRSPATPPHAADPFAARPAVDRAALLPAAGPLTGRPAADRAAPLSAAGPLATSPITISASIFGPGYWGAVRFLPS